MLELNFYFGCLRRPGKGLRLVVRVVLPSITDALGIGVLVLCIVRAANVLYKAHPRQHVNSNEYHAKYKEDREEPLVPILLGASIPDVIRSDHLIIKVSACVRHARNRCATRDEKRSTHARIPSVHRGGICVAPRAILHFFSLKFKVVPRGRLA